MGNSYYSVYEHIVFSTKNREKYFSGDFLSELFSYIAGIVKNKNCFPIIVGGYSNHVHILLRKGKEILTKDLVQEIKKSTSVWIKEKIKNTNFYWQSGYGSFSVSYWDLEKIAEYIKNQEMHHQKMNMEDEYKKLLIKHGVEFDEKYFLD